MKCKSCGKHSVLVEGLGEGKTRVTCQVCGYSSITDNVGRRMLTDDRPQKDRRRLITG